MSGPVISPRLHPARPAPAPVSGPRRLLGLLLPPLLTGLLLAGLYALVRAGLPEHRQFLMPSWQGLWSEALSRPAVLAEIWHRAQVTLGIAGLGLCLSLPAGMLIGVLMFRFHLMERAVFPWLVALQSVPILALIPLMQSAFGFGLLPKVLIVALFTFFAVPTTLLLGLRSLDRGIVDLFRLNRAGWGQMLWKAGLPSAAPALFAGFRIASSMAVIGAVTSELFFMAGRGGLGQMLINAKTDFRYEQMYTALMATTALSIGIYLVITWAGNLMFAGWHESGRRRD